MDASYICVGAWALSCARLLPQSYQYPNLSEGADRVGGQLRGDKECPVSGVSKSDRVWRKVLASDARSVSQFLCSMPNFIVETMPFHSSQGAGKRCSECGVLAESEKRML